MNEPVEEQLVSQTGDVISAMTDFCKQHINKKELERRATLSADMVQGERMAIQKQLEEEIKKKQMGSVTLTDDVISTIYNSNCIDVVPLLNNSKDTNFTAVSMYVDDQGVAKKLPVNHRATNLCNMLKKPVQVLGDCWVARCFDNDDDFIRYDMTFDDLNEDKPWIRLAQKINGKALEDQAARAAMGQNNAGLLQQNSVPQTKCADGRYGCSKVAKNRCARCKRVYYCSPEHQKDDWSFHKNHCIANQ